MKQTKDLLDLVEDCLLAVWKPNCLGSERRDVRTLLALDLNDRISLGALGVITKL